MIYKFTYSRSYELDELQVLQRWLDINRKQKKYVSLKETAQQIAQDYLSEDMQTMSESPELFASEELTFVDSDETPNAKNYKLDFATQ